MTSPASSRRRGRFDVWAPRPARVRLSVGDEIVDMYRGDDGWWAPDVPVPAASATDPDPDLDSDLDYGYLLDDATHALPDPRSRRQPHGGGARARQHDGLAAEERIVRRLNDLASGRE